MTQRVELRTKRNLPTALGSGKKENSEDLWVINLPVMQGTWVQSLGWEDILEKGMGTHFSILA